MSPIIMMLIAAAFGMRGEKPKERTHERKRAPSPELRPAANMQSQPATVTETPVQNAHAAAVALRDYLLAGGKFGTQRARSVEVRTAQAAMGVTGEDGIVGPKTRKAARALGVKLPLRKAGQ